MRKIMEFLKGHAMVRGQKKAELILYVALWGILFIVPVVLVLLGNLLDYSFTNTIFKAMDWQGVFNTWRLMGVFCAAFFIHDLFVAPLLVYQSRRMLYAALALCMLMVFFFCQSVASPNESRPEQPMMEYPEPMGQGDGKMGHRMDDGFFMPPSPPERDPDPHPAPNKRNAGERHGPPRKMGHLERRHEPPRALGGQDSVALIIMTLLMALNVGSKYFFKSLDDQRRMRIMEKENLQNQLKYLKYQINPHFFMNTLNNIHALVDIDAEQAKYTIEVLSKLMRYVLYEGNQTMVPLQRELDFIGHYIDLMRIRYTDRVSVSVSFPEVVPDVQVPSLLYATFIENAFKHGISYQRDSFIAVSASVDEASRMVVFQCDNSVKPSAEDHRGGVGLKNAVKRLQLIYGSGYELSITNDAAIYHLVLRLPMVINEKKQNDDKVYCCR